MKSLFKKISSILKRYRKVLLTLFIVNFIIWLFCLPSTLFDMPTSTVVFERDGHLVGARIAEDGQWRFPEMDSVPEKFRKSIIQFEDRQFYQHMGFSFRGFARAMKQNVSAGRVVSGGSTISMQVIRLSRSGKARSIWEKIVEVYQATRMEWSYSKEDILRMYASYAPMGGNVVGVEAASWRYFGRSSFQLSWAESATLAVLPNAPSLMHPGKNRKKLEEKRNRLLKRLQEVGEIDQIQYELALSEPLPQSPKPLPNIAPHLVDRIIKTGRKGKVSHTSLELAKQEFVTDVLQQHHQILKKNEIYNGAVLVLDVETGQTIAYAGNTLGKESAHGYSVDVIPANRSTGSILKPFLYASMLTDGEIMPDELVMDVPTMIAGYSPKNYNNKYDGVVSASRALSRSLNVPTVKMLGRYGVPKFRSKLISAGLTSIHRPASEYGLSLVLGGAEAKLWDLCSVYRKMAAKLNCENWNEPLKFPETSFLMNGEDSVGLDAFDCGAIYQTFEAMASVSRPEDEQGWAEMGGQKVAWKTGTSYGFRDAWAIGVTPKYVVGVWVGNADGEGRPGLVGVKAAAPILFDVFSNLEYSDWFFPPFEDMVEIEVCRESGCRLGSNCSHGEKKWVPKNCVKGVGCGYHKKIQLSGDRNFRVKIGCVDPSDMIQEVRFVLPSVTEKFFVRKNPWYEKLPPFKEGCAGDNEENPIGIIYPKQNSRIYQPVDVDGESEKVVFSASYRHDDKSLFWHLDEVFLGDTKGVHEMALSIEPGTHVLLITDALGNEKRRVFEILGEEN